MRFFLLSLCLGGTLFAQDLTVPLLSDSWQATFSNPALLSNQRGVVTVGLPGLGNGFLIENLTYGDLFLEDGDLRVLDLDRIPDFLEERNLIMEDFALETLGAAFTHERFSFGLSHRIRAEAEIDYPRRLVEVAARGNEPFIGQTVDIPVYGRFANFHELAFGISYEINDQLFIGGRAKYFSGIAGADAGAGGTLRLTTGTDNFALSLEQDQTINTAGLLDYRDLDDIRTVYDFDRLTGAGFFDGNDGFAADLGLFVNLEDWRLQLAVNDLGASLRWTQDVTNFNLQGTATFNGLDALETILEDSVSIDDAVDTLVSIFEPGIDRFAFRSGLKTTFLAAAEYDLSKQLTLGGLVAYYNRLVGGEFAAAVNARYRPAAWVALGLSYSYRRETPFNLGTQVYLTPGPVQLVLSTDNLLTVFRQSESSRAGFRIGAALTIGRYNDLYQ